MTLQTFLELVKNPGSTLLLLAVGIWWLNREREQSEARTADEKNAFRNERDHRLKLLEDEVKECKEDRRQIRTETSSLQEEVRNLMRSRNVQTDKQND